MIILRKDPDPKDNKWEFNGLKLPKPIRKDNGTFRGLHITFTPREIKLDLTDFPSNRVLQTDDQRLLVLASFATLRFPEQGPSVNIDYLKRFLKEGLVLNGTHYWFYGHSNSQLRSRSCFLRAAPNEEFLHAKILAMGDFGSIKNAAKLAKRIGLLFSSATLDWTLDPSWTKDIPDLEVDETLFSDGCGLISDYFSKLLSKEKQIIFRGRRYRPCVFQIRYKGYKGVLMLDPTLDKNHDKNVHFRKSMRKFKGVESNTFSVVEHSVPYVYSRLNNDIVTLLSALGVSNEVLIRKLDDYLKWLSQVRTDLPTALDFLSSTGRHEDVEKVLLEGFDSAKVQALLKSAVKKEVEGFKKMDTEKDKLRILVHNSRFVFGVCDPYQVLEEGEVFIQVTMPREGPRAIHSCPVLVVRNPCLHPGDCLKLRAVYKPELKHLVDCVVFASKGKHAAPSLSSGGDLDGDKYTVIWDKDLVQPKIAEHFLYPAVPERKKDKISRQDLVAHFAGYNSMGKAASLHSKWVRCRPEGAMSKECQELNALYSQCVDGAIIRIPDRLKSPPPQTTEFIVDILTKRARDYAQDWFTTEASNEVANQRDADKIDEADEQTIHALLTSRRVSMSEFQAIQLAARLARKSWINMRQYFPLMNFSALGAMEKHAVSFLFDMTPDESRLVWNSLMRSDVLPESAFQLDLRYPALRLQRLYTTRNQGLSGFFEYLKRAMVDYHRRLIIVKTDDRFSAGIFVRGKVEWDEESIVNDNVAVLAFTPTANQSMSSYRPTTYGYRLHCSDGHFQLYDKKTENTWIFMNRPPIESANELQTSIALQKISSSTQKHVGRINKTPIIAVEIHVVSNHDRVAQQIFDLRLDRVPTEEKLRSITKAEQYVRNKLEDIDWEKNYTKAHKDVLTKKQVEVRAILTSMDPALLSEIMQLALQYHEEERAFWIFEALYKHSDVNIDEVAGWLLRYPHLVFNLVHSLENDEKVLPPPFDSIRYTIIEAVIMSVNEAPIAALVAIEKLKIDISELTFREYCSLLWKASMIARSRGAFQEMLLVLEEQREKDARDPASEHAYRQSLQVAFERAEDSFENCPCDEQGRPTKAGSAPVRVQIHPKRPRTKPTEKKDGKKEEPKEEPESASADERRDGPSSNEHQAGPPLAAVSLDPPFTGINLPIVAADIRVDKPSTARLHSHVRLTAASKPDKQGKWWKREILDGVVKVSFKGEIEIELFQHPPPEYAAMEWNMYDCGSTATTRAMMDAVTKLHTQKYEASGMFGLLSGIPNSSNFTDIPAITATGSGWENFNDSQKDAIAKACGSELSLIWGPPGTGKTTVVIKILEILLKRLLERIEDEDDSDTRILMTASTHNAVDNVLERFAKLNGERKWIPEDAIVRAATDNKKVSDSVKQYTVDAMLGGSPNDDPKLIKKAEKRIKAAKIVFTTCAGAGLGTLRNLKFGTVLIDEASQIPESVALIPLAKSCNQAVLVGDHVQLRPTVKRLSEMIQSDVSLFERLYTGPDLVGMTKSMLNVQYRFDESLARYPSRKFYNDQLRTGTNVSGLQDKLRTTDFPWPKSPQTNALIPNVFVPCSTEEDYGGQSKQNAGQAKLVAHIVRLLMPERSQAVEKPLSVAVLTPYTKQVRYLQKILPGGASAHTIDGFQGREADFIVYSSVRCNQKRDIGFLTDERRLNVAWTRARVARIVVGDEDTLVNGTAAVSENAEAGVRVNTLWREAINDCQRVGITLPEEVAAKTA